MKTSNGKQLAKKMLIAMICGLACGFGCIMLREHLVSSGQTDLWTKINNLFFQDITQPTATKAVGIFYIVGQLFVNSLQLIIVPMVFVSITLAISTITDTKKLGRISTKTILTFFITTVCALCFAGVVTSIVYRLGFFNAVGKAAVTIQQGSTGSNPLNIILNIIPNNLISAFSTNGNVLAIVFIAVAMGLAMNTLEEETKTLKKLFEEVSKIITLFLSFVVNKFAPIGIFCLLTRTFAIYGIDSLRPALAYVVTVVIALFVVINPLMIYVKAKKQAIENPVYKNPTYYTLRDDGIFVELGEESATIEWNRVYKITHFMGLTLLYTGKQQAFVFPDYELGDDREKMLDYMKEHIKEARKKAVQTQTDGGDISKYSKASTETEREETEVSESEVQENSEGEE